MNKTDYLEPTCKVLLVRFEGAILKQSGDNQVFQLGGTFDGEYEDE